MKLQNEEPMIPLSQKIILFLKSKVCQDKDKAFLETGLIEISSNESLSRQVFQSFFFFLHHVKKAYLFNLYYSMQHVYS